MISGAGRKKNGFVFDYIACTFGFSALVSVAIGSTKIPLSEIFSILIDKKRLSPFTPIIWDIRIPRIILTLIVGASLAASGALFQSVIRNPIADPGIIGVSSGVRLGLLIPLLLYPQFVIFAPLFAFVGAMEAAVLEYLFAWKGGIKTVRLILSGIAVNAFFTGVSYLITILNNDKLPAIALWLSGSFAGRSMYDVRHMPYGTINCNFEKIECVFCKFKA